MQNLKKFCIIAGRPAAIPSTDGCDYKAGGARYSQSRIVFLADLIKASIVMSSK